MGIEALLVARVNQHAVDPRALVCQRQNESVLVVLYPCPPPAACEFPSAERESAPPLQSSRSRAEAQRHPARAGPPAYQPRGPAGPSERASSEPPPVARTAPSAWPAASFAGPFETPPWSMRSPPATGAFPDRPQRVWRMPPPPHRRLARFPPAVRSTRQPQPRRRAVSLPPRIPTGRCSSGIPTSASAFPPPPP